MAAIVVLLVIISSALLGASIPHQPFVDPASQAGSVFKDPSACKPTLNSDNAIKVNVNNPLYTSANPDFDKTNDEWVLVKKNAPIPAWKVLLRTRDRDGQEIAEMEKIGTAQPQTPGAEAINGNDVFIGTGWCNPEDGENWGYADESGARDHEYCLDPLVQDVVFVVTHTGATDIYDPFIDSFDWPISSDPNPPRTEENINQYFWKFDVYYKKSKLPADNPTTEDLPCWIERQCYANLDIQDAIHAEKRFERAVTPNCEVVPIASEQNNRQIAQSASRTTGDTILGYAVNAQEATAILSMSEMTLTNPPGDITMTPTYLFSTQLSTPPDAGGRDELIGTINSPVTGNAEFNIYLRRGNVAGEDVDHAIIIDPAPAGDPDGPYFMYVPILNNSQPEAKSLQLGSFLPGIPSYFYEWWTPSCKPALYLYPERETTLSVIVRPNGHITESIPEHGVNGWHVIAQPDGTLYSSSNNEPLTLGYLYYEAAIKNVSVPKDSGWITTTSQLPVFFADVLPQLGLNETEGQDFIEYWLPKLESEGNNWFITLIDEDEVNRTEPVSFSVQPDHFHRIRFYFENIDEKPLFSKPFPIDLTAQDTARDGFTVIDWGGIVGNGSCGLEEVSQ